MDHGRFPNAIDTVTSVPIYETISFPKGSKPAIRFSRQGKGTAMSQHQTVFTAEKALPAAEAAPGVELPGRGDAPVSLQLPATIPAPVKPRRHWLRNLLLAGAAVAALGGAADFG